MVDKITCCQNGISPESKRNIVVKKSTSSFNQVPILSFGETILLWCESKMFDGGYPVNS